MGKKSREGCAALVRARYSSAGLAVARNRQACLPGSAYARRPEPRPQRLGQPAGHIPVRARRPGHIPVRQILAGAITAATQAALRRWYAADPPVALRPLLQQALDKLASACSDPA
jgi:hypothetical protein